MMLDFQMSMAFGPVVGKMHAVHGKYLSEAEQSFH